MWVNMMLLVSYQRLWLPFFHNNKVAHAWCLEMCPIGELNAVSFSFLNTVVFKWNLVKCAYRNTVTTVWNVSSVDVCVLYEDNNISWLTVDSLTYCKTLVWNNITFKASNEVKNTLTEKNSRINYFFLTSLNSIIMSLFLNECGRMWCLSVSQI